MKLRSIVLSAIVIAFTLFISCKKKDKDPEPQPVPKSGPVPYATLSTNAISTITGTSAIGGGNVEFDGGSAINTVGVCWDTTSHLSISKPHTTNAGSTGSYTSAITGLLPNTTYYVRAYATNATGTSYGNEVIFTTQ